MTVEKFAAAASRVHTLRELSHAARLPCDKVCMESWGFSEPEFWDAVRLAIVHALAAPGGSVSQ